MTFRQLPKTRYIIFTWGGKTLCKIGQYAIEVERDPERPKGWRPVGGLGIVATIRFGFCVEIPPRQKVVQIDPLPN